MINQTSPFSTFKNKIGLKTKEAIAKRYGTDYRVGSIASALCKFTEIK